MEEEYKLVFTLVRPAKAKGGDRYEAPLQGEPKPITIYIPQIISRKNNVPNNIIEVIFKRM